MITKKEEPFEPDHDGCDYLCPMWHSCFEDCVFCGDNNCGDECVYAEDSIPETTKEWR